MYLEKRSIALYIILTIITCGFFGIYWLYKMADDLNYLRGDINATSPGLVILFSIITCGIYQLFWLYKAGQTVDDIRVSQNLSASSKAILYLLLALFGFGIVSYALLQNDFNEMADSMNDGMNGGRRY